MKVGLHTHQFPAARRLEAWRGILCDTFVGIDCTFADDDFRSVIEGHVAGDYGITRVTSTARQVDRSPTLIKRDASEILFFGLMLAGRAAIAQGGREAILEPGTIVLHDSSRPFRSHLSDRSDVIWVAVPKASLGARANTVEGLTALRFVPSRPVQRIAHDVLTGLDEAQSLGVPKHETDRLIPQMLDMLALTMMADAPGMASAQRPNRWRH